MLETNEAIMNERDIRISGLLGTLELLPEGHPSRRIYEQHLREVGVDEQERGTIPRKAGRSQDHPMEKAARGGRDHVRQHRAAASLSSEEVYLPRVAAEGRNF